MLTARESQAALRRVVDESVASSVLLLSRVRGSGTVRRAALLDGVPALIDHFGAASGTLALDQYQGERARAGVRSGYAARIFVEDRTVKIRRAVAWASDPLMVGDDEGSASRLTEVVSLETARPYRETIAQNVRRDPEAAGWRRIASASACKLCRMLADKGAIYKRDTVHFAAHDNCTCTAQPRFGPNDYGDVEASTLQYQANGGRLRTAKQKAELRAYLNSFYPDARG